MKTRFVIVTPVRDEEAHLRATIQSVTRQTVVPVEWVIVDDGSTDGTWSILEESAREFPWIRPVQRSDRGFRKSGGGVVEAFNVGYSNLTFHDWDFIVKLRLQSSGLHRHLRPSLSGLYTDLSVRPFEDRKARHEWRPHICGESW